MDDAAAIDQQGLLQALFAAYPDSLIVVDERGGIVLANDTAARLLGYTVDELKSLTIEALVPDAIRARHAGYRKAYGAAPVPRPMGNQMDLVARCKDGSHVMVEIALSPLQGVGPPLVAAAIRSIESYPRVQQALKRAHYAEQLAQLGRLAVDAPDLQTLLAQVPVIAGAALDVEMTTVFLLEGNGTYLRIAAAMNPTDGEAVGSRIPFRADTSPGIVLAEGRPLIVADYRSEQRFVVSRAYLDAGLRSGLAVPVMDQGRIIGAVSTRSRTVRTFGDDEVRFLESLSSILATSLQRAKSDEALSHAQRLETVGQLTGGIAHDFNNLLTIVQGNLQLLEDLPLIGADPAAKELLASATHAAQRGADLTRKLLAFSRRQVLQPISVDVAAMLSSLVDTLRRTIDQRIRIELRTPRDPLRVLVDPAQLESALLNIAINARDAMPDGGTLRFNAEYTDQPLGMSTDATAGPQAPGHGFVAISIADEGSGMSEQVQQHAFEPFFTTKETGRGTGLGLSAVYGFIQQSSGSITLDTWPGIGTTITLYIPRSSDAVVHAAVEVEAGAEGIADIPSGLRVLMVEDDPDVSAVSQSFLLALGCQVTGASNGESALKILEDGEPFDLLITDIALGAGMRGTRLAALAQALRPGLAILLTSGFSSELLDADRESPADWELLGKPYRREQLAEAIARVRAIN